MSFYFDIFVLILFLILIGYVSFVAVHTYSTNKVLFWLSIALVIILFGFIIWNIVELASDAYGSEMVKSEVVHSQPVIQSQVIQAQPIQSQVIQAQPIQSQVIQAQPNYNSLPVVNVTPI